MKRILFLLFLFLSLTQTYVFAQYTPDSIYTAARAGNLEKIQEILNGGFDLNMLNNTLASAVVGNQPDIIHYLVEKGADPNHLSSYNSPLLNNAIVYGFHDSALALIESGAKVETRGFRRVEYKMLIEYNWTALMCAARSGNIEIVQSLLKHGADPTEKGWSNSIDDIETPADVAAYSGHLPALKLLMSKKAEISSSTIFKTVRGGHMETFKYLLKKEKNINRVGPYRKTLLMEASWWGRTKMVKYLLKKRADVNAVGGNQQTALMEIAGNIEIPQRTQMDVAQYLLKKGANVHYQTNSNLTALKIAQKTQRHDLIQLLRQASQNQ